MIPIFQKIGIGMKGIELRINYNEKSIRMHGVDSQGLSNNFDYCLNKKDIKLLIKNLYQMYKMLG